MKSSSIVAVHGLNPWDNPDHALDTWRKPKGDDGRLWLRDDLPKATPYARILNYSYRSNSAFGGSKEDLVQHANSFLETVRVHRHDTDPERPLIFIAFSLGGILIKQASIWGMNNRPVLINPRLL